MTASDNEESSNKPAKVCRPSVSVVDSPASMSNIERKLTKLFKCCFYRDRCFFTTDDSESFLRHLNTRHSNKEVSCIYCYYQSGETEPYEKTDRLIDHILTTHGLRVFQCNLCVYRGSSVPHVLLHQANIHGNSYLTTLSGDGNVGLCKVLVCKQVVEGPLPSETVYWSNCRVERIVIPPKESPKYQCLYCEFVSLIPHVVFFHICKVHPDYNLSLFDKYVDPLPEIKEAEEHIEKVVDDEDAELDAIVNDIHSIDTKDDDIDMTPVDDAPPEDFSDDDESTNKNQLDTVESRRERLFALKGVRIAKKQPDKPGRARKSTGKQIVVPEPEPDFDKDEEEEPLTARQRIMRGYRPEQSAALFKPIALTGNKQSLTAKEFKNRNMFKCLICADNTQISRVSIENHLMIIHNTTSSFKCSECSYVGSSKDINLHFKSIHSSSDSTVKFIKFIVAMDETEEASQPMLSQPVRPGELSFAQIRNRAQEKDPKNLSSKIKKTVFVGPKNWRDKQKQKRKETGEDSDESEEEINQDEPEAMEIDNTIESVVNSAPVTIRDRSSRVVRKKSTFNKRKASEIEDEPSIPVSEELLEPKSSRERESEYFFCLFCPTLSTKDFSEAQAHMKRHLGLNLFTCSKCSTYQCDTIEELKKHHEDAHPSEYIPLNNTSANNTHINFITEFLNEQFKSRRTGDQMSPDHAARYARIICPICERANQITNDINYHFNAWKPFKTHFWKHANAKFIRCHRCTALVPRTRKRFHLEEKHPGDINGDVYDIKDFTPYYFELLPELAICSLKSYMRMCKAFFVSRIKEEFEIEDCYVDLKRMKMPDETGKMAKIKEEPQDINDM